MPSPLVITGYDPVHLDGLIDSASALQVAHSSNGLYDYGQSLEARHEDLSSPSETIRVELADFTSGGYSWQITASHDDDGTNVTWSRDTNQAYCEFAAMTDAVEVDVLATSNASPPTSKTRKIWVKTTPLDGQPDRP